MPGSFGVFDDAVAEIIRQLQPKKILDIGTGAGKYGKMLRDIIPDSTRIGIEIEASYVEQYGLNLIYHEMQIKDAATLMQTAHDETYDLVIIGDCIEHLPKSVGLDLLNFLTYRTQYTLVLAPEFCIQGSVNGVGSESHISVWSERDFLWHDMWAFDNAMTICLFLLRGYQPSPITLEQLAYNVNVAEMPVYDFYREKQVRNIELKLQQRRRIELIDGVETCFRVP